MKNLAQITENQDIITKEYLVAGYEPLLPATPLDPGTKYLNGLKQWATIYTHPTTHPYSMITGAPTSLPASGGHALSATHLLGDDTRAVNSAPSVYMGGGARYAGRAGWQTEFKTRTAIDTPPLSGTYVYLQTHTPWSDPSGGYPIQVVYGNGTPCWRVGVSTSAWSAWQSVNDNGNASTVNGFTVGVNVPANAKFTDTVYSHPASHPASIITQDTNNRFVSDNEKGVWSGKQDALGFTPVNTTDSRLSDARTPTAHNHDGTYQPIDADLTAIAGLTGTTGLLRKTAANTWTLDTTALGDMTIAVYGGSASGVVAKADSLKETRAGATEKIWVGTKAQYDAITTKDAGTSYITTDETYGSYISLDETGHILASYMPLTVSAHIASISNPHGVTKSQVGLGNVNNTADIDKPISLYVQNALDGKAALNHTHSTYAPINNPTFTGTVSGITATMVGLGNVANESKSTMFTNPTFTGAVSGITATMIGLGSVTNESKSTMFTSPTFTGVAKTTGNTSYTTSQLRNIFLNTTTPTSGDGSNGDVWIVYT